MSKRARKAAKKKRSFLRRRWWLLVLLTPIVLALVGAGALLIAYARIQLPQTLPPIQTTILYDRHGTELATLHGAVDRTVIPLSEIPEHLRDAVIAVEDHDFYNHAGVSVLGSLRAAWTDLVKHDTVQGGSTLTQQLIKQVYAGQYQTDPETGETVYVIPPRTIKEKIREGLLALKLEHSLTKDQILSKYLNTVYFGHGAYGVEAAAQTYFGKPASRLTILESATLAGTLHAPELYDPIDRPYDARFRRDYALDQMVLFGYLDPARADKMKTRPCCGTIKNAEGDTIVASGQAEYFVDYVRNALTDRYGGAKVYGGGLRVTTSLDLGLQAAAEDSIANALPDPKDPDAALVAVDNASGQILAMAGGRDWQNQRVNLATDVGGTGRQAGSAFKAFTLAAAMQQGYDLNQYWSGPNTITIRDCPDPDSSDGYWHPVNAEGSGSYPLIGATAHSVNTVFAQVIAQLGPQRVVEMAHALGIRSDLPAVCAITLGSVAVNPLEMTNAYATIAAEGEYHPVTPFLQVKNAGGRVDPDVAQEPEQVLDSNDAALVTYALQDVLTEGTAAGQGLTGYEAAGKTGTAKDNVDAWFCGYTVQITTCVWVGYRKGEIPLEDIEGVSLVFGADFPAEIWHDFMTTAMDGREAESFPEPSFDGYTVGPEVPVYVPTYSPAPVCESSASADPSADPCPSPSASESPSPEPTPSHSPSQSPSPSHSPSPSPSPTTPSPTPSPTASPTAAAPLRRLS